MWSPFTASLQSPTRLLCTTTRSLSYNTHLHPATTHCAAVVHSALCREHLITNLRTPPRPAIHTLAGLVTSAAHCFGQQQMVLPAAAATEASVEGAVEWSEDDNQCSSSASTDSCSQSDREYSLVNFYHLSDLPHAFKVVKRHREFVEGKDIKGRIYISRQGINAQFSGEKGDALEYVRWVADQLEFQGLRYIIDPVDEHQFPKLRLKYKDNLVQLAGGTTHLPITDPKSRATPLQPAEWKEMLREAQSVGVEADGAGGKKVVVLDVRNAYEWDAGHFEGAPRPLEDNFNETPTDHTPAEVPAYLQDVPPDTPVMMYCTGGIRCDIYSTYLRSKGFQQLYTLEGGVHNYIRQQGSDSWKGSLFVFDGRMAVPAESEGENGALPAAVPCQGCGSTAYLPHMNCANIDCNKLFVACHDCKTKFGGCCCAECVNAPRLLRPEKTVGFYGTWSQYSEDKQQMVGGRGSGRLSRRRARQMALREREQAKRMERLERRQRAKAAMAERHSEEASSGVSADEDTSSRMARLLELRAKLEKAKLTPEAAA